MAVGAAVAGGALIAAGATAAARAGRVGGQNARRVNYGGKDQGALNQFRDQYAQGIDSGRSQINQGLTGLGQGVAQARQIGQQGQQLTGQGRGLLGQAQGRFDQGAAAQTQALNQIGAAARGDQMSAGQAMIGANARDAAARAQGMAATARGGNQGAAMNAAAAAGNLGQRQAAQQMQTLRAQEMEQARGALANAATNVYASGAVPGSVGLAGIGQGMGAQEYGAASRMGAGEFVSNLGAGREGAYLGAQQNVEQQQLAAQMDYEARRQGNRNRVADRAFGFGGTLLGGGAQALGAYSGGGGGR